MVQQEAPPQQKAPQPNYSIINWNKWQCCYLDPALKYLNTELAIKLIIILHVIIMSYFSYLAEKLLLIALLQISELEGRYVNSH